LHWNSTFVQMLQVSAYVEVFLRSYDQMGPATTVIAEWASPELSKPNLWIYRPTVVVTRALATGRTNNLPVS